MFRIETYLEMPVAAHKMREWRKFRRLTLQQFADRMNASLAAVSRVERGDQRYNQDYLERAAEVLACEPADLLTRDPGADDGIMDLWGSLSPEQRAALLAMARVLKGGRS